MAFRNVEILVHVFASQALADEAVAVINEGENIPYSETAKTRTYCQPHAHENGTWYIIADAVTQKYLPVPEIITIKMLEPDE